MYRVVLYGLIVLSVVGILFGFLGILPFNGFSFLITLILTVGTCYMGNMFFSRLFRVMTNSESYLITGLILFLILAPVTNTQDIFVTIAVSLVAMASKYLLAIDKKHIFNPAAFGVFLLGLLGFGNGIWWVGSLVMLPFVSVIGFLIVRKIRRPFVVFPFFVTAISTICLFNLFNGLTVIESLQQVITSWPIIFFATVMLTEPLTTPPRFRSYVLYSALVGVFFGLQFHIGPLFASPEFALVIGNIFSYIVSPKYRLQLVLEEKKDLGGGLYEFVFAKPQYVHFTPGQYFEWTLPEETADSRGNRRYFTIASSPTESVIRLGVKIDPEHMSSFKRHLLNMKKGDLISASQLAGDFSLHKGVTKPVVFIAGGIGITPFRSILQSLIDTKEKMPVTLFYTASSPKEFAYQDVFASAEKNGAKTIYVVTREENVPKGWKGEKGRLSVKMITRHVSNPQEALYYISGPNSMVDAYKHVLREIGVSSSSIITDYFPGY